MSRGSEILASTQRALPVALIATPRKEFLTCRAEDGARAAAKKYPDIDHLPVMMGEKIIGLFDAYQFRNAAADQRVGDAYSPLCEDHMIGADASILEFIQSAELHSCRLLVYGTCISGLVTISDLQALPVRTALFSMITQLEMIMSEEIRDQFPNDGDWLEKLTAGRRLRLEEAIASAKATDGFVDALLFTQFCDKAEIVRKTGAVEAGVFKKDMKLIQMLRDNLAHSNRYANSRDQALRVCDTVRNLDRWIRFLADR